MANNLESTLLNRQAQPVGSIGQLPYRMPTQQQPINWMQKPFGPAMGTGRPTPPTPPGQNPATNAAPPTGSTSMTPPPPGMQPPPNPAGGTIGSMMGGAQPPAMQYGQKPPMPPTPPTMPTSNL